MKINKPMQRSVSVRSFYVSVTAISQCKLYFFFSVVQRASIVKGLEKLYCDDVIMHPYTLDSITFPIEVISLASAQSFS